MEPAKKTKLILYVEDVSAVSEVWLKLFKDIGYEVRLAASSNEAREIFNENRLAFDLAFVDLGLPVASEPDGPRTSTYDDVSVGLDLLEYLRSCRPDMGLIAASNLPEGHFTVDLIARLVAGRISFAPFRFQIAVEEVIQILWFSARGYVVYPPALTPLFKRIIAEPESHPILDDWEYFLLSLRVEDNTLKQIDQITGVSENTLRDDFSDIYRKLEDHKLIPEKEGERRTSAHFRPAYEKLHKKYGDPIPVKRPSRKGRYREEGDLE